MAFKRNNDSQFLFSNEYNLFSTKNWYNFIVSQYNVFPDILKIFPSQSMKNMFFDYKKYEELIQNQDTWKPLGKEFFGFENYIKTNTTLTRYFKFKEGESDKEILNEEENWDNDFAYAFEEDLTIPESWESLHEALSEEWNAKNIIECENENGDIVNIEHDRSQVFLIDKKSIYNPELLKDIKDDFCILIIHDGEYYNPFILYKTETETEKKIFNQCIKLYKHCLLKKHIQEAASVSFIVETPTGYDTKNIKISDVIKTEENLYLHTNDDFKTIHKKSIEFLNSDESGLIIYRGIPGSGKTSYIKYLTTILPDKQFLFVSADIMGDLGHPNFISFLTDNKNSVIILEDCEQLLVSRDNSLDSPYINEGLINLLNMTDGILGSAFNFKFICTFNSKNISKLDNALLRKGRCKVNYEFKELSIDKIEKLIELEKIKDLWNGKPKKKMSVTELYNTDDENYQTEERKKIGF